MGQEAVKTCPSLDNNPSIQALRSLGEDEVLIALHVKPGARQNRLLGLHDSRLKIAVTAPPDRGKANASILAYMAKILGLGKSQLTIACGKKSRLKNLHVRGLSYEKVAARVKSEIAFSERG